MAKAFLCCFILVLAKTRNISMVFISNYDSPPLVPREIIQCCRSLSSKSSCSFPKVQNASFKTLLLTAALVLLKRGKSFLFYALRKFLTFILTAAVHSRGFLVLTKPFGQNYMSCIVRSCVILCVWEIWLKNVLQ